MTHTAHAPLAALPQLVSRSAAEVPVLHVAPLGVTIRTLVATAESGGTLAALDYAAPPGFRGPAPHWHAVLTETFIGVEGEPRLRAGDREVALEPGAVVVVPPRVVHAFSNPGDRPARFLVLASPGMGIEDYFPAVARLVAESPVWPPANPSVIATLAARYDTFNPPAPPNDAPGGVGG